MNDVVKKIKWVTQAMAHSCEEQKSLFTDFSNVASKLAVEWEHALEDLENSAILLNDKQKLCIKKLDEYMSSISGQENIQYWDNIALCESPEWETMRQMANEILDVMNWEKILPEPEKVIVVESIEELMKLLSGKN